MMYCRRCKQNIRSRPFLFLSFFMAVAVLIWDPVWLYENRVSFLSKVYSHFSFGVGSVNPIISDATAKSVISVHSKSPGDEFWTGTFRDVPLKYLIHPFQHCSFNTTSEDRDKSLYSKTEVRPVIIMLSSMPGDSEKRNIIRKTWASVNIQLTKVIFCLGLAKNESQQARIEKESAKYRDILQFQLFEKYSNLAYKTFFMLNWAAEHCSTGSFIMKADTDTVVWLKSLDVFRHIMPREGRKIWGACTSEESTWSGGGEPHRQNSKWAVSREEWNYTTYPTWCSGTGYVMTGDVPPLLIAAAKRQESYFHLEDVMFTGIAAQRANVTRHRHPGFHAYDPFTHRDCAPHIIMLHNKLPGPSEIEALWRMYEKMCSDREPKFWPAM